MHLRLDPALYQQLGTPHLIFSLNDILTEADSQNDKKDAERPNRLINRHIYYAKDPKDPDDDEDDDEDEDDEDDEDEDDEEEDDPDDSEITPLVLQW